MISLVPLVRNIRHIQIKKVAYHPNLFKAILTFEGKPTQYDPEGAMVESDDIEYVKYLEHQKDKCPHCEKMLRERRSVAKYEY